MRRAIVIGAVFAGALLALAPAASARPSLAPNSVTFATPQTVGTLSPTASLTLRVVCNIDPANPSMCFNPEPFTPVFGTTGDFSIASEDCPPTLPGDTAFGTTCQIQVTFGPTTIGERSGALTTGSPFAVAALKGTGQVLGVPVPQPYKCVKIKKKKRKGKKRGKKSAAPYPKCKKGFKAVPA